MRLRAALAATAILAMGLIPTPRAEATHKCNTEEPYCVDYRTLVQKPGRQVITSRVLGHHCWHDVDEDQPNRDRRVLRSRIEVVFSDVTRDFGYLESLTIYFEPEEQQVMGWVRAFGRDHVDFDRFNDQRRNPGDKVSFPINKKVEFNDAHGEKDMGVYNIRHDSAATGAAPYRPGPDPRDKGRYGDSVDCHQPHFLVLLATPPSAPPCRNKPPNPCPPQ